MAQKPSIPKGTRDFSPTEVAKRNYIFDVIKKSFELFGFQPIETPSFENSSTLLGKYGEEGDRLIFKILNSGDYIKSLNKEFDRYSDFQQLTFNFFEKLETRTNVLKNNIRGLDESSVINELENFFESFEVNSNLEKSTYIDKELFDFFIDFCRSKKSNLIKLIYNKVYLDNDLVNYQFKALLFNYYKLFGFNDVTKKISDKALRYDLTVPFARYVVQHQNEITFPFKRYQMQLVWRADRPQKGRFREFYQCDADVVGSKSLFQEIEFVQLYDNVFTKLGLQNTLIKINNRKILSGIAGIIGAKDKLIDFTVALDKLDKIGEKGVIKEMLTKGISEEAIVKVKPLFNLNGTNEEKLRLLKVMLAASDEGLQGVDDLQFVIENVTKLGLQSSNLELDVTLARGLNYYTGAIFEVLADKIQLGSIGGGGRYDDLTSIFGLKDMSGIGISFGLDRIYLALEELNLFKQSVELSKPKVLFLNFGEKEAIYCLEAIKVIRESELKAELYPDNAKLKKQMNYANKREIELVVLVGSTELENKNYTLKNMNSGEQTTCNLQELLNTIKNL